ncbi:MAG: GGDEF domain-containing protein [Lachnospiraceae bacterium]|nr:GGDEF domain-containing protein [Lachnospiraceae bacterium]
MWKRIKNYAFYGDTDKDSYQGIKEKIENSNRTTAMVFAIVASILICVMFLLSFFMEGFAASRPVYSLGIILSLVQVALSAASKKNPWLSYVSVYMAVSVFLLYGIAIATLTRPEEQTVTFMVMLIFVPLIFVDRPIRMAFSLIFHICIFIFMAYRTKRGAVLAVDVTDAVIFGLLAIVSETVVYRAKIRGYVLENVLHMMSETDQLTGLNNRNCYERCLLEYPELYRKSVCCIYIDVNGLHELNNTKGHKAGDEMLQYIAEAVKRQFGGKDSYRIGGDEYVAFVLDETEEEVRNKLAVLKSEIAEAGYHAAIGWAHSDSKGKDFQQLIGMAEAGMYADKSDYYRSHDRRSRGRNITG